MRKVKFDFGHLMIQKLNRTFVMTKSTLGVLNYRVRVIQLWFCFGLISESDDQNLATLDLSHTPYKCQAWTLPGSSSRATAPAEDQFLVSFFDIIIFNTFYTGLNHCMVLFILFIYKK